MSDDTYSKLQNSNIRTHCAMCMKYYQGKSIKKLKDYLNLNFILNHMHSFYSNVFMS